MIDFKLNQDRCIQCGECVADCPVQVIAMEDGGYPSIIAENNCIGCQHCLAVCPTAAISILGKNPDESLAIKDAFPTAESMSTLIKGRRSVRRYKQKSLDETTLNTLLETALHAPTGVNARQVLFTVTRTMEATNALRTALYKRLEELLSSIPPEEDTMLSRYMRRLRDADPEYATDFILRGAPHVLIASSSTKAPSYDKDSLIALSYFDLLAQCWGLGTVWNGMLTWCVRDSSSAFAARLSIPEDHQIGYAMAFGAPAVRYHRTVQHSPANINVINTF
ncbi:nitroreductase family protein [Oceanidesulfovibrio marinus]|uniref:Nitroreductase n=1 Tax=Oceanidesulfovibrio marinus TaxID=370038 RepID=A0A6P1ZK74_9BACT|nr:nitroreductase family protein [Oceanidesulfovibrio marinus]TVM34493.1 nitroreductase [Oceanidesulfovibrio marinus]